MDRRTLRSTALSLFAALAMSTAGSSALAAGASIKTHIAGDGIEWSTAIPHGGAALTIVGPGDFYTTEHVDNVSELHYANFPEDGLYKYELTLEPMVRQTRGDDAGGTRSASPSIPANKTSGSVRVVDGQPIDPSIAE